ncbi:hypothetical protein [Clostridium saccharoperbutylacetonicum]|uniref:hypothetical protein n=1 Tax=Clostridium saccharoperbutylacetonicum TaxID=36745 RepID=UPI0039ED9903
MNELKENYNSFNYWENVLRENKNRRAHVLMQKLPTEKSAYFHTILFGKKNGMHNMWGYVPNIKSLVGYLQYPFLQEAFYRWAHGEDRIISQIPQMTIDKISKEGEKAKKITRETATNMRRDYDFFNSLWILPHDRIKMELEKFIIDFNRRWIGNNQCFIYIKVFNTPEEVGEFVISSSMITSTQKEFENKIGMTIEEWREVCKLATSNSNKGGLFKEVLQKKLSEVY